MWSTNTISVDSKWRRRLVNLFHGTTPGEDERFTGIPDVEEVAGTGNGEP